MSDVLDTVALKGTLYFRTDFSPPFAIQVPAHGQAARFHFVVQGRCHVVLPDGNAVVLNAGELVLVPHGSAHVLADAADRPPVALDQALAHSGYTGEGAFVVGSGDPGASTQMICGHFTFADGADHPLLRALPAALQITAADRAARPILDDVLSLMARRIADDTQGAAASVSRLSEVLYIEALRAGIDRAPDLKRLLSAVHDPQIGKALDVIHHRLDHDWTVDSLAAEVAMSRTRFSERFSELMGAGPMTYLTDWRLQRALALLSSSDATVQQIAHRTGYNSADAFSRAFRMKFGRSPQAHRQKVA